jgi:hypothetical protein
VAELAAVLGAHVRAVAHGSRRATLAMHRTARLATGSERMRCGAAYVRGGADSDSGDAC